MLRAEDAYPITRFHDVGAIAYYLKAVAWEIPDFTVDRYAEPLLALHRRIERTLRPLDVGFHLFLLVAERISPGSRDPASALWGLEGSASGSNSAVQDASS